METLKAKILQILSDCGAEIRQNMQDKGINASGRTSASIHVRETDGHLQLVGGNDGQHTVSGAPWGEDVQAWDTAPIPSLETGTLPLQSVPKGFYYIIKQWTRDKGIPFEKESERETFAYFLSRKIAREGTRRHKEPEDVYTTPVRKAVGLIKQTINADTSATIRAALSKATINTI